MSEKEIFGSEKLQWELDKYKSPDASLERLLNLWIDPQFAEQCSKMFKRVWASAKEILKVERDIIAEDKKLKVLTSKNRVHRLKKAANEVIRKAA